MTKRSPLQRADGPIEDRLRKRTAPRLERIALEQRDTPGHVGGTEMEMHRRPVL